MADKGIWWSLQPFLDDEDANPQPPGSPNRQKQLEMSAGTDTAYKLAKKYKIKTAWGTDTLFDAKLATRQGAQLVMCTGRARSDRPGANWMPDPDRQVDAIHSREQYINNHQRGEPVFHD